MDGQAVRHGVVGRGRAEYVTLLVLTLLGLVLALPFRMGLVPALLCTLTFREVGKPTRVAFAVFCVAVMAISFAVQRP